ncbi:hypothetical protein [Streptomyces sp. NPDC059142]|uniref:hypothetical protein n=1 Tax=unclassified Streptomyces TaxID=2593676 RepID=UPI0036874C32
MSDQRKSDTKNHETHEMNETNGMNETHGIQETHGTRESRTAAAREPRSAAPPAPPRGAAASPTAVTPVKPLHAPDAAPGSTARTPGTGETPAAQAPTAGPTPTRTLPTQPPPTQDPVHSAQASPAPPAKAGAPEGEERLFPRDEGDRLSERLQEALNSFVDGPRRSVEEAAGVLEEAARQLTTALAERPRSLRAGWDGDRDARAAEGSDTEELRLALQSYREMTQRLLRV